MPGLFPLCDRLLDLKNVQFIIIIDRNFIMIPYRFIAQLQLGANEGSGVLLLALCSMMESKRRSGLWMEATFLQSLHPITDFQMNIHEYW